MPELPEVEIVKQSLSKKIERKKIKKIRIVMIINKIKFQNQQIIKNKFQNRQMINKNDLTFVLLFLK